MALSRAQGFVAILAEGTIWRGWALVEQGKEEEGIAEIRQGMAAWRAAGSEVTQSCYLALLTEVCGKLGQAEEGLTALAEGLALANKTGGRFWEAELWRLKGELTIKAAGSRAQKADRDA